MEATVKENKKGDDKDDEHKMDVDIDDPELNFGRMVLLSPFNSHLRTNSVSWSVSEDFFILFFTFKNWSWSIWMGLPKVRRLVTDTAAHL